ncbi:MAG: manganese efflux pump [Clostridiales bacterium]|nr:manganese efflux pump [Clostridiales bacterium]
MDISFLLLVNSLLLGMGLAMDAFSVSLVNGLYEPKMRFKKALKMTGAFAVFQGLMPLIGWALVHTAAEYFVKIQPFIPIAAFIILSIIGLKMLIEGISHVKCKNKDKDGNKEEHKKLTPKLLLIQAIATSIDALSVGFTIAEYKVIPAIICAAIIAAVTQVICLIGVKIGKKAGSWLSCYASMLGGIILIGIGIEILVL